MADSERSDSVREFVLHRYVEPARQRGDHVFLVRVADVHEQMHLKNSLPAVSAALGANKFIELAHVKRLAVDGPLNGASCLFIFRLDEVN